MNVEKSDSVYQWFALRMRSGSESKVFAAIKKIIDTPVEDGVACIIQDVFMPVDVRTNKRKVDVERKILSGYILVKILASDEVLNFIKTSIEGVSGFLSYPDGKPRSINECEIHRMKDTIEEKRSRDVIAATKYHEGDGVVVCSGPFESFVATVLHVDEKKSKIKLLVSILGRDVEIDVDISSVRRYVAT